MVSNIWVAASDNQIAVVEEHLKLGKFSPDSKDPNGYTPIHAAASYGHIDLLKLLIGKGGNINIQDNEGDTPLHHCEDLKTAKVIIEELGGDINIKNQDGQTPLEFKEEDDEFPDLVQYLRLKKYGDGGSDKKESSSELLTSLPMPGNVDGQNIRYTMQAEEQGEVDEDRRKQIEAIINGENPEEGLRQYVANVVHEGMAKYQEENSSKRRKE